MSNTIISVENLSKSYRLGQIGTGRLAGDFKVWWARKRGKPNPFLKIGEMDHGNREGETIWALKDVSFSVEQGDTLGIIGRNGAGKSTLLKILSQVTAPTSGLVKIKGRIASLLEVGTGFHPDLTGRENTYLNGAILGMTRQEVRRKLDEIVAFAEIEQFLDTPVKRYSSGMFVRLAFAVAAHLDPEILIVDEVLAVGDAEFQKKCLGKMGDVAREGRTVLFVSHNLNSIHTLCKNAMVLEKGSIIFSGENGKAIAFYLRDLSGKTAANLNEPIGDERFRLNKAYLNTTTFKTDERVSIFFDFDILIKTGNLRIGFDLIDSDGLILFRSWHDDMADEKSDLEVGHYLVEAIIPENLLKPGSYKISVEVGIHAVHMIIKESYYIEFDIVNISGINKLYNDNHRSGVILPGIQWKRI